MCVGRRSTEARPVSLMSPETGPSIGPQFDRGGRFSADSVPLLLRSIGLQRKARGAGWEVFQCHISELSSFWCVVPWLAHRPLVNLEMSRLEQWTLLL